MPFCLKADNQFVSKTANVEIRISNNFKDGKRPRDGRIFMSTTLDATLNKLDGTRIVVKNTNLPEKFVKYNYLNIQTTDPMFGDLIKFFSEIVVPQLITSF
jgi:hypothetical protein